MGVLLFSYLCIRISIKWVSKSGNMFKPFKYFFISLFFIPLFIKGGTIDSLKRVLKDENKLAHPDKGLVKASIYLSDYYTRISFDTAKYYAALSRTLAKKLGNPTGIAMANNITGMNYTSVGYYDSAVPYLNQALENFKTIKDTTGIVFVQNNLAVVKMHLGKYADALKYYQQNLAFAESKKDYENMLLACNNMGITYHDWKKYDRALFYYKKALGILNTINEEERKGSVYNNIGEVYQKMGKIDSAQFYFEKSYLINKKYNKQHSLLITITSMGDINFQKGNYREAYKRYKDALVISKRIPDDLNTSLITIKIGKVLNKLNKYSLAKSYLLDGLKLSEQLGIKNNILEAYKGLIENGHLTKDPNLIYTYHQKYMALNDSLFNDKNMKAINEMEAKFKTAQKEREIAILTADKKAKELEIQMQRNQKYFIIIAVLLLLFVAYLLFNRYRIKQLKIKTTLEKARISIEQRLLRSQMNPHFIFNSLNSIGSFIGTKNISEAQSYLTKFAKLMRLILENSRKPDIPLEDEIQALQLNLELEKLRFENRFDFELKVDEDIDTENTYISPMLIQPFIENAIKHGFKNKKDKGFIKLSFTKSGNLLICEIEDNGIGREKAEQLKQQAGIKHNSLGTQVTSERFEDLKTIHPEAGFTIIDLKNDAGNPAGTKVIVKIPFEEE